MTEPTTLAEHRRARRIARRLKTIDLDALEIAAPCPASWAGMEGDGRSRFCGQCEKNVFDLSTLTRAEIAALFVQADEQVCVRLYRRADGTIMTADCPIGLAARLRRRVLHLSGLVAALGLLVLGFFGFKLNSAREGCGGPGFDEPPLIRILGRNRPEMMMGGANPLEGLDDQSVAPDVALRQLMELEARHAEEAKAEQKRRDAVRSAR